MMFRVVWCTFGVLCLYDSQERAKSFVFVGYILKGMNYPCKGNFSTYCIGNGRIAAGRVPA